MTDAETKTSTDLRKSGLAYFNVIIALWCLLGNAANASDENLDLAYMTLNGLAAVVIEVDGMQRDFSRFGLDSSVMIAETTKVLHDNGIEVLEPGALNSNPAAALMRIKINANENQFRFYFYGISVELKQKIPLNNSAGGYISGTIWKQGQTGIVMPTELRSLNGVVAKLVTNFVRDYRTQNVQAASQIN